MLIHSPSAHEVCHAKIGPGKTGPADLWQAISNKIIQLSTLGRNSTLGRKVNWTWG